MGHYTILHFTTTLQLNITVLHQQYILSDWAVCQDVLLKLISSRVCTAIWYWTDNIIQACDTYCKRYRIVRGMKSSRIFISDSTKILVRNRVDESFTLQSRVYCTAVGKIVTEIPRWWKTLAPPVKAGAPRTGEKTQLFYKRKTVKSWRQRGEGVIGKNKGKGEGS